MVRIRQQVARELLFGELVERQIAIERVDDPLPIAPRPRARAVLFVAVGIGVAREVEPVARPLLAEVRRGERAVDHALVCVGAGVLEEGGDFGGRRRQSGQVERHAADQGRFRGFGRRLDVFGVEPGQDEIVDRIASPRGVANGRRSGAADRLERPVEGRLRRGGPRRARVDPGADARDLGGGERSADRRHDFLFRAGDHAHEAAGVALARLDDAHRRVFLVEPQAAHLLLRTVADIATLLEKRLHLGRLRAAEGAHKEEDPHSGHLIHYTTATVDRAHS